MAEPPETYDVESSGESDENDDVNYQACNFSLTHNNRSFREMKILSAEDIFKMMEAETTRVCDVSQMSPSKARSLLHHYKWDTEKFLEFMYAEDRETLELMEDKWVFVECDPANGLTCEICFDEVSPEIMNIFTCNHRFCVICFANYIQTMVTSEGGLIKMAIKCPGHQCIYEIDEDTVLSALQSPELLQKYKQIIANSFVENKRNMKWCPSAGCNNAVQVEAGFFSAVPQSVRCDCRHWFCFHCHDNSHDPIDCAMLTEWKKIKADDLETQNWILVNTKQCPKCQSNIEKNGGCMHMTCRKCNHQFCWVCMQVYAGHGQCGGVKLPSRPEVANIRRLSNYSTRYETMKQAFDLDLVNYKSKMVEGSFVELKGEIIRTDFVNDAIEILLQCRRTLMHSYIFSYFTETIDNQIFIFDENLKFLEAQTEQLSHILENEVSEATVQDMKSKIVDGSSLCNSYRSKLMDHIKEGHEKNWWHRFPIKPEVLLGNGDVQALLYDSD